MNELVELYRKELAEVAGFKNNTVGLYVTSIYRYLEYAQKRCLCDPIRPRAQELNTWIAHLKETEVSLSRLKNYQVALRSFFTFARKMGIIDYNPADYLFPIRRAQSMKNQPISTESAFKLLGAFDRNSWIGKRDFMIVSMLWALGLRLSECLGLKVGDFDPQYNRPEKIGIVRIKGKGRKERILFVVDLLYDNLVRYLEHPDSPKRKSDPIFPTAKGTPVSKNRVQRIIKETAKKVGIPERVTPHVLRHSFATEMYHKGVPGEDICRMMGHDSIEETSLYIHVSDDLKKEALEKITIPGR